VGAERQNYIMRICLPAAGILQGKATFLLNGYSQGMPYVEIGNTQ